MRVLPRMFSQTRNGRDETPPSPNSEKLVLHCSRCRVRRVLARQMNRKSRTLSKLRLHGYVAVMTLDNLLGHGEAHAQATRLAGATGVGTPKTTEDARQIILGDTDARIRNRDIDVLAVAEHRHHDPTPSGV